MRSCHPDDKAILQSERRCINRALKTMQAGFIPESHLEDRYGIPAEILEPFDTAYAAAEAAAKDQRTREIESTPIDDAAWEAELRRRAEVNAYLAHRF